MQPETRAVTVGVDFIRRQTARHKIVYPTANFRDRLYESLINPQEGFLALIGRGKGNEFGPTLGEMESIVRKSIQRDLERYQRAGVVPQHPKTKVHSVNYSQGGCRVFWGKNIKPHQDGLNYGRLDYHQSIQGICAHLYQRTGFTGKNGVQGLNPFVVRIHEQAIRDFGKPWQEVTPEEVQEWLKSRNIALRPAKINTDFLSQTHQQKQESSRDSYRRVMLTYLENLDEKYKQEYNIANNQVFATITNNGWVAHGATQPEGLGRANQPKSLSRQYRHVYTSYD